MRRSSGTRVRGRTRAYGSPLLHKLDLSRLQEARQEKGLGTGIRHWLVSDSSGRSSLLQAKFGLENVEDCSLVDPKRALSDGSCQEGRDGVLDRLNSFSLVPFSAPTLRKIVMIL